MNEQINKELSLNKESIKLEAKRRKRRMNEEQKLLLKEIEAITNAYENCELETREGRSIEGEVVYMIDERVLEYLEKTK